MRWPPYKIEEQICISEMYSFFKSQYDKTYYYAGEMHPFWECVYVVEGSICAVADDRMYNLSGGELIFHKPLEMHKFHVTTDETATIVVFSFSAEGKLCKKLNDKVFVLSEKQKSILLELINFADEKWDGTCSDETMIDMYLARFKKDVNYSQTVVSYLYRLMLSLVDEAKESPASTSPDSIVFSKAVDYMNQYICRNPKLEDIARHSGVSTAGLKRIFSGYTGLGVHRFFLKLKLKYAAQMLSCGQSVTEVADKLGFSSQAYFSKAFKRETNVSPSKYGNMRIDSRHY
ncbi:MAG: helix-turn-helix domain-containing protein [Ruminococcaceae bacterium]|nr:helix-turn-helix domain-containing protein [Oscillospiraceae bacterium]